MQSTVIATSWYTTWEYMRWKVHFVPYRIKKGAGKGKLRYKAVIVTL